MLANTNVVKKLKRIRLVSNTKTEKYINTREKAINVDKPIFLPNPPSSELDKL
jgi:O-phosphoseryl-tRNA(Cys) synthetase